MSEPQSAEPVEAGPVAPARPRSGIGAIMSEEFSALDAVGGARGITESVAPGLLFVVVYLAAGQRLMPALIAAAAASLVAVVVRLVQRTPVTQALSGVIGVVIGVVWAWRSGEAQDYFAYGLWINVAYLAAFLLSIAVRYPLVGLVVGLFSPRGPLGGGSWAAVVAWRGDRSPQGRRLRGMYTLLSWAWAAMFAARLAVQLPLYLSAEVAWLGTTKLAMGVPLTALVLWLSWLGVRSAGGLGAPPRPPQRS